MTFFSKRPIMAVAAFMLRKTYGTMVDEPLVGTAEAAPLEDYTVTNIDNIQRLRDVYDRDPDIMLLELSQELLGFKPKEIEQGKHKQYLNHCLTKCNFPPNPCLSQIEQKRFVLNRLLKIGLEKDDATQARPHEKIMRTFIEKYGKRASRLPKRQSESNPHRKRGAGRRNQRREESRRPSRAIQSAAERLERRERRSRQKSLAIPRADFFKVVLDLYTGNGSTNYKAAEKYFDSIRDILLEKYISKKLGEHNLKMKKDVLHFSNVFTENFILEARREHSGTIHNENPSLLYEKIREMANKPSESR